MRQFKVSILTLLLITAIIGLIAAVVVGRLDRRRLVSDHKNEIDKLHRELHYFDTPVGKDEIRVKPIETTSWRFFRRYRIYLPPDKKWQVRVVSGILPRDVDETPTGRARSYGVTLDTSKMSSNGFLLDVAVVPEKDGDLNVEIGASDLVLNGHTIVAIDPEVCDYLSGRKRSSTSSGSGRFGSWNNEYSLPLTNSPADFDPREIWHYRWHSSLKPGESLKLTRAKKKFPDSPRFGIWIQQIPQ